MFGRSKQTQPAPGIAPARTINLEKDPGGRSAVDLEKVRDAGHIDLAKRAEKSGIALSKRGLAGIRAKAVFILDHSGSMHADYANGKVQTLVERALGYTLQIDSDGVVPVIPFDHRLLPTVNVGLADDRANSVVSYRDVVNKHIWLGRDMGSTALDLALARLLDMAKNTDEVIYAAVGTDGNPNSKDRVTRLVCELASYPVFIKFLAIREVPYLQELDDAPGPRLVDNVDAKFFDDPAAISDLAFADAMADEWDSWFQAATAAGILR